jgi:hypothetical protein
VADAIKRIAVENFHKPEIREIAVQSRRRALARFLNGMHRKFDGDAAGGPDPLANPFGQYDMVPVARRQIGPRLCDSDDGFSRAQFVGGQAEIQIVLQIERRHVGMVRIVEPGA